MKKPPKSSVLKGKIRQIREIHLQDTAFVSKQNSENYELFYCLLGFLQVFYDKHELFYNIKMKATKLLYERFAP